VGKRLTPAGIDARNTGEQDHVGIYRQRQPGMNYVGLKVHVGRIKGEALTRIAGLAERYGNGELRLSPGQAVIIPNVSDRKLGALADEPLLKEFAYNPSPLYRGLVSCVGSDYCNLAVIETKSRAVDVARELAPRLNQTMRPITMHWSGCPAGCGNHLVADVGLLGKKIKVNGNVVDGVDVYVGGRSGPDPKPALKILEDVPCDRLPTLLEHVLPYHTRERMHRVRKREPGRRAGSIAPPARAVADDGQPVESLKASA
jgi:ferredoxin-nitrite reductase